MLLSPVLLLATLGLGALGDKHDGLPTAAVLRPGLTLSSVQPSSSISSSDSDETSSAPTCRSNWPLAAVSLGLAMGDIAREGMLTVGLAAGDAGALESLSLL